MNSKPKPSISMKPIQPQYHLSSPTLLICFFLCFFLSTADDDAVESIIREIAFKSSPLRRTGVEFKLPLPANLTGVEASAMKMRSRTLWLKGANLSSFHFPPGILPNPYRRRLLLVQHNLGSNLSASLYGGVAAVAGFSLAAPVIGVSAYDAWNVSTGDMIELGLSATGESIGIGFPLTGSSPAVRYCVRFGGDGEVSAEGEEEMGRCSAKGTGRFGVVVASSTAAGPSVPGAKEKRRWRFWAVVCGGGVGGLVLLCGVGIWVRNLVKSTRLRVMKKKAEEGEKLGTVWVGGSRMPSAGLTRTHPVLEDRSSP